MRKILLVLFCASIPAIWYLVAPGGYEPHDLHHLADIYEMRAAILSGQIPPRLGPDYLFGMGYPLFNFYYVLPFYLGAFFYALTGSLMAGFKLVFLASVFVSLTGMYFLLRKFFGTWASTAGAILYLYTPFRAVEIYVRGAIGEALALAILPWVLYFLVTLVLPAQSGKQTSKRNIAISAFVLVLFYLAHNYFFLLTAPFILFFVAILIYFDKKRSKKIKAILMTGALSAGLSAFWWLPAFAEYKLVASGTPFVLIDHFPFLKQLIVPSWGYGSSVWGPYDEISFQIGIANLAVLALVVVIFLKQRKSKNINFKISLLALLSFLVVVFMMNIRSLFIWNLIPFTNFIQFPWRLLTLTTFFTAFLAGFVVDNLGPKKLSAILLATCSMLLVFFYFRPSKVTNKSDEEYVKHFFSNPQYSEDYLQLPLSASERSTNAITQRFAIEKGQVVFENEISKVRWKAEISADEKSEVTASVLNFPGWYVKVDGNTVETYPSDPYGQLTFGVDKGTHEIELYWAETNLRLLADIISLLSLGVVLILILPRGIYRGAPDKT
ncbi:hypothetical protein A2803_02635 [Candidatus Woesebacteria bacterium RIFCSPHIGHO2_01_FULL_44_21]|uniref:Membrane protein 6-pyruvoyl-tetrahydropterin synthase-related domain-containing protein n=1 Tax=Candidatus Woesebacteria bacterium RIFCSPHIGHO2_01_FULL_44_21 TaxID=1802503 RepID=A0A1F7YXE6_9BACT|nr:MAG: hypothetical protein A2803_02635 [Candidatus Woesebacteria bacterium RIFCSPHIGHO2_01_FULL_44_21]OGM69831.1 MAG: hypothetical protein A2897_00610 [Candidatus Woesebacteria bacterium RIFCSPLOWO2_01_FULL_44_24b]